jgi:radical SAM enzyme (rSAM/lipoprotein system)
MRKDLPEIGRQLKKRGYPWGMVTNGVAMTPTLFRELRQAGLRSLAISLDGLEEDHKWLRQSPLAYEGACRTIRLAAAEKGLIWDVVTCITRRSIGHLDQIRDLVKSLGVQYWRIFGIDPMGRAATNPELVLNDDEFKTLIQFIRDERIKTQNGEQNLFVSYSCEGFLGDYEGQVRDYLYQCSAGVTVASILVDGHISACTSIRGKYYQGNIYKDHFWEVWENGFKDYRDRSWMKKQEPCDSCSFFRYCEGNGMHLRREDGSLMLCHLHRLQ